MVSHANKLLQYYVTINENGLIALQQDLLKSGLNHHETYFFCAVYNQAVKKAGKFSCTSLVLSPGLVNSYVAHIE